MMFTTLTRYIAMRIFKGILLAFIIVTSIILLVDFVEGARDVGADENLGALTLMKLTLYKAPQLVEQTIPFIVLFGVMGSLYSLNVRSELIVLRASGLSAWRFLKPALFVTASIGILWATVFNPLAAASTQAHQRLLDSVTNNEALKSNQQELWLREGTDIGQTVIHAQGSDLLNRTLTDVTFYMFETNTAGQAVFKNRIDTKQAKLLSVGYWQLTDARESTAGEFTTFQPAISLPTTITIQELRAGSQNDRMLDFWEIPSRIQKIQKAGFSTTDLRMQYHKLLSLPLTLIAMTFIAAGVSMQLTRQGGTFKLMLAGGGIGFAVFFINNVTGAFGEAGTLPVLMAAWAIPIFVLCLGVAYLSRIEDG